MVGLGNTTNTDPKEKPSGPLQELHEHILLALMPSICHTSASRSKYMEGLSAAAQDKRQNDVLGGLGRNQLLKRLLTHRSAVGHFNGGQGTTGTRTMSF